METPASLDDLKQRTARLRHSLQGPGLADVLQNCVAAIVVHLPSGEIVESTRLADECFGYIEGELRSMQLRELIPARVRDRHDAHFEKYVSHPTARAMGTTAMTLVGLHRDGSEFPVAIGLVPRRHVDGERYVVATILRVKAVI